jgi:hypothetical protein
MTSISADGSTQTIYVGNRFGGGISYSINDTSLRNPLTFPCQITNTNTGSTLKVLFVTNITLTETTHYFTASSSKIQFGSESLNSDGTIPVITIDGVTSYPGVFRNGTSGANGYANVSIYNLQVRTTGGSTVGSTGGWVAQAYFSKAAAGNSIVNCSSTGDIASSCGGIAGSFSASQAGGNLTIRGCWSTGNFNVNGAGGIVGIYAAQTNGTCTIDQCYSTGTIGTNSGGILANYGASGGTVEITNCFTLGQIGDNAGGIAGPNCGRGSGSSFTVSTCYSEGAIQGASAGGILGIQAGSYGGSATVTNSYSRGAISGTTAGGIFGENAAIGNISGNGSATCTNCYTSGANGAGSTGGIFAGFNSDTISQTGDNTNSYKTISASNNKSEANAGTSGWNTTNAQGKLNTANWVIPSGTNIPFKLKTFGFHPYSLNNIISNAFTLAYTHPTINAGDFSNTVGLISGISNFAILTATSIQLEFNNGRLIVPSSVAAGTYTLSMQCSLGSYVTLYFTVTLLVLPPTVSQLIPTTAIKYYAEGEKTELKTANALISDRVGNPNLRFSSQSDYIKYKMGLNTRS